MIRYRIGLLALVASCAVVVWALPAGAHTASMHISAVTVTAGKPSEFRFTLTKKSAPIGIVSFHFVNKGTIPHDFKIFSHTTRVLSPGQSQTIKVTFKKKGSYSYLCTVAGHAANGMRGFFKIT